MKDFFSTLKTDRKREILDYKDKGYDFQKAERHYQYIRNINVKYKNNDYKLQIRVDNEIRFHLTNEECNIYLTVQDIYFLLLDACIEIGKDYVRESLETIIDDTDKKILILKYRSIDYNLEFPDVELSDEKNILIYNSNIKISYFELILIIVLIHNKSNYYFMYKKDEVLNNHEDGFVRLLIALIYGDNYTILNNKGWKYNNKTKKYVLFNTKKDTDDKYYLKYYLTKEEYNNIMN